MADHPQALVDSIYAGIVEPTPWQPFLQQLRQALNCQVAGMWFRSPFTEQATLSMSDSDEQFTDFIPLFFQKFQQQSLIFKQPVEHGEVTLFSEVLSKQVIKESAFYADYLKPNDIIDGLQLYIEEPNGLQMWIQLGRSSQHRYFDQQDKDYCNQFSTHLCRALTIYSSLKNAEARANINAEVVEQLSVGIITLDRNGHIVDTNDIAKSLLTKADGIEINQAKLRLLDSEQQQVFRRALDSVITEQDSSPLSPSVEVMRIPQRCGMDLGLLIRYAATTPWYQGRGCPSVVIYLCDPAVQRDTREAFVAKLFGLTLAEASLAILLSDGMTISEAAISLALTENSARTVSKRIFAKTGTRRQAELVKLILNSVAILG
ncbi:hypothetical protein SIN8267_01294 [Sinobacterium norvegicum]|uniref:HTH luxR-type domain-containing protein n=1 Tax=Sinobacterium norvegicum TaxID=1641715 RepID=A0ABM9ADC4_9GAMM|nr:helix-turn-helix transcriptional regulator [Sinobacterium norvegicum]CAH0991192.1 hypothetical protein SIN8267_01294 [Sinobacterium norvegicum]